MKSRKQGSDKTALSSAISLLSRRQVSVFQLQQKLQEKGFSDQESNGAVQRLLEWKYLDDYSYALAYVKSRRGKMSKQKLFLGLTKVGIDKELSQSVLAELWAEENELALCLQMARKLWDAESLQWEKKYKTSPKYRGIPQEVFLKKKVGDKLLMRGYLLPTIKTVLAQVLKGEDFTEDC